MAKNKIVLDYRSNTQGISNLESNEQQRNWTQNHTIFKAKDPLSNYDPTRFHLNFEIAKGGKIQPIDTTKSIAQKFADNLAKRNIIDPNARKDVRRPQRTIAQFILSGSTERMRELAFGTQMVDFNKNADNSHITRDEKIELWAKDVYQFMAKKFGEENIVGFYVHLDETAPHIHCSIIPVDKEKNRISWTAVFGKTPKDESFFGNTLLNEFETEVGRKWNLEKGDPFAITNRKHRSTEEYKRDLLRQINILDLTDEELLKFIHKSQIKIKSLTTMIDNLMERKENILKEIEKVEHNFSVTKEDENDINKRLASMRDEIESINQKIAERQDMLDNTAKSLEEAKERLAYINCKYDELKDKQSTNDNNIKNSRYKPDYNYVNNYNRFLATYNDKIISSFSPVISSFSQKQHNSLNDSNYIDLTSNPANVINCAALLFMNFIHEATTYAQTCGGGGISAGNGWEKRKDEDDELWLRKCINHASTMVKPASGRKRGKSKK